MNEVARADPWRTLRTQTPARIALGRSGSALTTAEVLRFGLAHARASARRMAWLVQEALRRQLTGVALMDETEPGQTGCPSNPTLDVGHTARAAIR